MLKSFNLLHKCGLGDSDMSSTVNVVIAPKAVNYFLVAGPETPHFEKCFNGEKLNECLYLQNKVSYF